MFALPAVEPLRQDHAVAHPLIALIAAHRLVSDLAPADGPLTSVELVPSKPNYSGRLRCSPILGHFCHNSNG
jgi:hypothetical protein